MNEKFHIDAVTIRSGTISQLEKNLPSSDHSIFSYYPHIVVSIDYAKSERHRHNFIQNCPEFVIVDEAHRFRNEDTQSYEWLSTICRNRKVILLSATPFNNTPADIFSLLKLMIVPGKSKITLDENLEAQFAHYNASFRRLSYISRYYNAGGDKQKRAEKYYRDMFEESGSIDLNRVHSESHLLAEKIRNTLEPVLIRRNRLDLRSDPVYSKEISELSEVADPKELFFELTSDQSQFYDQVVNLYFGEKGQFKGAIYQPFLYEKRKISLYYRPGQTGNRNPSEKKYYSDGTV